MGSNHKLLHIKDVLMGFLTVRNHLLSHEEMAFLMTARLFYQRNPQLITVKLTQASNGASTFIPGGKPWQMEVDPVAVYGMTKTQWITLTCILLELTIGLLSTVAKDISPKEGVEFVRLQRHCIHVIEEVLDQAEKERDPLGYLQMQLRHHEQHLRKIITEEFKNSKQTFETKDMKQSKKHIEKRHSGEMKVKRNEVQNNMMTMIFNAVAKLVKIASLMIQELTHWHGLVIPSSDLSVQKTASNEPTPVNREHQQECYKLLLSDVKSSPVKFIQSIYKEKDTSKIVVNVKWGKQDAVHDDMKKLDNFEIYFPHLNIQECEPSTFLMQNSTLPTRNQPGIDQNHHLFNIRVGSGSLIAGVNEEQLEEILNDRNLRTLNEEQLEEILNDRNLRTLNEVKDKYSLCETGTLTCLAKSNGKFYAVTSQHVLNTRRFSGQKPILSQIHFESQDMSLADIVHLSSSYHGCLKTISFGNSENVVDVTLLPIHQTDLDENSLKLLTVFTRNASHGPDARQNSEDYLEDKIVTKRGAMTGETKGKITRPSHYGKVDPTDENSASGEMFGVSSLNDQAFAEPGDSGAIVMIKVPKEGQPGQEEQVLGILSQLENGVALCVRMEDCLTALESIGSLDHRISRCDVQIYTGFLKPLVAVRDRRKPHVERSQGSDV